MTARYMHQTAHLIRLLIVSIGCMALTSCYNPQAKQARQQAALVKNEAKTQDAKEKLNNQASAQIYATTFALSRAQTTPTPDPAISLAKTFASRAQITLGQPTYEDALFYESIITGLLSTNATQKAKAQHDLRDRDGQIADMEDLVGDLQLDKEALEHQLDAAYQKSAQEAQTWVEIKRLAWWIGGQIGALFLIALLAPILALAFPMIEPVAGLFASMVGGAIKKAIAIIPKAADKAGVVAKSTYDLAQGTLEQVVVAVQEAKKTSPEAAAALKPILEKHTDIKTRPVIAAIKADYAMK